jgi:hypothetical protein
MDNLKKTETLSRHILAKSSSLMRKKTGGEKLVILSFNFNVYKPLKDK